MAADLLDVFERWRATKPRHRAHTWLDKDGHDKDSYTLQELWTEAGAVAAAIRGVEVAILCYPPGLEFLVAFYGCLFAGVAAAPCYPPDPRNREARTARHFETIIEASGAQVILTTAAYLRGKLLLVAKAPSHRTDIYLGAKWLATDSISCEGVPPLKPPPSLAFLQYTSGSTSAPKGVMVGRRNLAHNLQVITEALDSNEDTVCVSWLPQYHDMGLVGSLLGTLYCGGTGFHSSPLAFVRDPTSWLRDMTAKKATHTQAPSFAYGLAARKYLSSPNIVKVDLSTLKHATNGAEPIRAADVDAFAAWLTAMVCMYGVGPTRCLKFTRQRHRKCIHAGYPVGHTAVIGWFSKAIKQRPQGLLMGLFASAGSVARIVFPVCSGMAADAWGPDVVFATLAGLLGATLFVLTWWRRAFRAAII
mgnify:CR=1 FL=1